MSLLHRINARPTLVWMMRCEAILVAAAIWVLSSQSRLPQIEGPLLSIDKVQHALAFGALALGLLFWFRPAQWQKRPIRTALIVALIASLYGLTDELHQHFVPDRASDIWDWVADTMGGILVALWGMMQLRRA